MTLMNAWHALTFDERKFWSRGVRQDRYQAAIAEFNANIPLSPSVSGDSSSEFDPRDGGVIDRRAIQRWNRHMTDYRGKNGKVSEHIQMTPVPFLRLPFDIRRIVFVKRACPVVQMEPDGSAKHPNGPVDLRIAFAGKQLFNEVCKTFFEENIVRLDIRPGSGTGIGLPILFNPEVKSAALWPLEGLKRVEVFIPYSQNEYGNFVCVELTKYANIIQKCSLTQLQITAFCIKKRFRAGLDESFDQALAPLVTVRGVQDLCFTEDLDSRKRGPNSYSSRVVGTKEYRERLRGMLMRSQGLDRCERLGRVGRQWWRLVIKCIRSRRR